MGGGASCNGLVNCSCSSPPSAEDLRTMKTVNTGNCVACPANLHDSCPRRFGPEWVNDYSVSEGVGCKMQCKRSTYSNNSQECCIGIQSPNKQLTCNPALNATHPSCTGYILNYCSNPTNINNSYCQNDLKTTNLKLFNDCQLKYCLDDINRIKTVPLCRDLILTPEVNGTIDRNMVVYCQRYPDDQLCCHLNSEITCPNKFDTRCVGKAVYSTTDMLRVPCPDVLTCNQYVNLSPDSKVFATKIELNCGSTKTTGGSNTLSPSQEGIKNVIDDIISKLPDVNSKLPDNMAMYISNTFIYLSILFLIFVVILILIIIDYRNKRSKNV